MPRGIKSIKLPESETWKDNFRSRSLRTNLSINLSKAMLEYLCAVADGVQWNRAIYPGNLYNPDNFIATSRSLELRGLICLLSDDERKKRGTLEELDAAGRSWEWNNWKLTPAGECIVQLLTRVGMFVESDLSIKKKSRGA